jgi:hypothetical protein
VHYDQHVMLFYGGTIYLHTNIKHQSLCGCFLCFHSMLAHAMYNWAHKIDGKNTVYVHHMKDHRDEQEPVPPELRHGEE